MSTESTTPAGDAGASTETEALVLRVWSEVLKRETIDLEDDFFAIGGNSMTATLATYKIREELEVELPLMAIFEAPTARELAVTVDELVGAEG